MIRALAGFSTSSPWKVITLWVPLGMGPAWVGQAPMRRVTESQLGDFLPEKYDSAAGPQVAERKVGVKPDTHAVTMLVKQADGKPLGAADQRAGAVAGTALLTGIKLDPSTPQLIGVALLGIGVPRA
ncbi:hypothetical protein ABZT27_28610 [Streptomyces sp. NPDC005389]|uniref:hypothetical protein n=1 Tax=Streptomyces sp. NPDC005389 TaxID=3157040 RepID=UPI0033BA245A